MKFKKGIEESILRPGFSINPEKISGNTNKETAAEIVNSPQEKVVEESAPEIEIKSFNVLLIEISEQFKAQLKTNLSMWIGALTFNEAEKKLHILVDTRTQESELLGEKSTILAHFRGGMNLPELDFNIQIKEVNLSEMANKRMLTPQEKIDNMIEKNPLLKDMLVQFDLKVES